MTDFAKRAPWNNPIAPAADTNYYTPVVNSDTLNWQSLPQQSFDIAQSDTLSKPAISSALSSDPSFLDSFAGYTAANGIQHAGWGTTGIKSLSGLMSMWNGYQANQLAQKQYELSKQAFEKNYAASVKAYNNSLTNQANRMAARGESAMNGMTADEYTAKYGLSK